jgi:DNA polymerase-4
VVERATASVLHVDMDAFFAAVEALDNPALVGVPLIVGGTGRRGVVASCSYEARVYGVRSAMPSVEARRRCPHALFVAGRYHRYSECSRAIHEIFSRYTPLVEGIALDEAFLDVSGSERLFGPPPEVAAAIRRAVAAELGLSCSVGVAATKFVAKLASEEAKPVASPAGIRPGRGVVVVAKGEELAFLHPLPVEALWGVGPATAARLRRLGLTTVGQLAAVPAASLETAVGRAHGRHLHQLAWGIDPRPVVPHQPPKSIGHEETWAVDRRDPDDLRRQLVRMADSVSARLRQSEMAGRTVTLKIRFGDFKTLTRSRTLEGAVDAATDLVRTGYGLLAQVDTSPGVRLMGLSVSGLVPSQEAAPTQLDLGLGDTVASDGPARRWGWQAATGAIDAVRRRFGDDAVGPVTLLGADGIRTARPGDSQWGPGEGGTQPPSGPPPADPAGAGDVPPYSAG